jgi:hypothetical protein
MYRVINQGKVVRSFQYFFDAWLYAFLDLPVFSRIKGPDGVWVVNPPTSN